MVYSLGHVTVMFNYWTGLLTGLELTTTMSSWCTHSQHLLAVQSNKKSATCIDKGHFTKEFCNVPLRTRYQGKMSSCFVITGLLTHSLVECKRCAWSVRGLGIDHSANFLPSMQLLHYKPTFQAVLGAKLSQLQLSFVYCNGNLATKHQHVTQFSTSDWEEIMWYTQI